MSTKEGFCSWARCQEVSVMGYRPNPDDEKVELCSYHWVRLCRAEGKDFGKAMQKLGYTNIQERTHTTNVTGIEQ